MGKPFRAPDGTIHAPRPEGLTLPQVFFCGGMSGVATSFLLTPVELIKCRLQIDKVEAPETNASLGKKTALSAETKASVPQPKYKGTIDCAVKSIRNEGVSVLYKGFSATLLREVFGTACWFTTYEYCVRKLAPNVKNRDDVPSWTVLTAGAISGVVLNFIPYPFDTIKSILQTFQVPVAPSSTHPNSTAPAPPSSTSAPSSSIQSTGMAGRSPAAAVAASSAVYSAAPVAQRPFSTLSQGNAQKAGSTARPTPIQPNFFQMARLLVRTYGIRGLYAGLTPAILRAIPANAAIFFMYETLTRLLRDIH